MSVLPFANAAGASGGGVGRLRGARSGTALFDLDAAGPVQAISSPRTGVKARIIITMLLIIWSEVCSSFGYAWVADWEVDLGRGMREPVA